MYGGGVISGPMDLLCTLVGLYQLLWISRVRWWGYTGSHSSPVHGGGAMPGTMEPMCRGGGVIEDTLC